MRSAVCLCVALALTTLDLTSAASVSTVGKKVEGTVWSHVEFFDYPRDYGPPIVTRDDSGREVLIFQGSINCNQDMTMISYDPKSGKQHWLAQDLPDPTYCDFNTPPQIAGGSIFYIRASGYSLPSLVAISVTTGSKNWETHIGTSTTTMMLSVAAHGSTVAMADKDRLHGIDAKTGAILWNTTTNNTSGNTHFCAYLIGFSTSQGNDMVVCTGFDSGVSAYDLRSGAYLWGYSATVDGNKHLTDGRAIWDDVNQQILIVLGRYGKDKSGALVSLSPTSGQVLWTAKTEKFHYGDEDPSHAALSSNTAVLVGNKAGGGSALVAFNLTDGSLLWTETLPRHGGDYFGAVANNAHDPSTFLVQRGATTVEARTFADNTKTWSYTTPWCASHNTTGVECTITRPYSYGSLMYNSVGSGIEHDLLFAVDLGSTQSSQAKRH